MPTNKSRDDVQRVRMGDVGAETNDDKMANKAGPSAPSKFLSNVLSGFQKLFEMVTKPLGLDGLFSKRKGEGKGTGSGEINQGSDEQKKQSINKTGARFDENHFSSSKAIAKGDAVINAKKPQDKTGQKTADVDQEKTPPVSPAA